MSKNEVLKNTIRHYVERIETLQKNQKLGLHDYTKAITTYYNKIFKLLKEL